MNMAGFFLVGFLAGYLAEELQNSSRRVREHEKDLRKLVTLHQSIVQSMTSGLLTVDLDGPYLFEPYRTEDSWTTTQQRNSKTSALTIIFPGIQISQPQHGGEGHR